MEPMDPTLLGAQIMDAPPPEPDMQSMTDTVPVRSNVEFVDDEIRSMINRRKEASRVWRQAKKEIWDKCMNHYKQVYDTTNKESWQSTTFIPASVKVAEVITSNMHSALLAPDRPVEYQARQPTFEDAVRNTNDLIAVDCERSEFKVHMTDVLRTDVMLGTGIGKVEYKKEYAEVTVKERLRPNPILEMARRIGGFPPSPTETTSKKRMLVKDFASTRNVDIYNCYPEPGSTEIDKDHWFIEEGKICNYRLLELANDPDNPVRNITNELLSGSARVVGSNDQTQERDAALDEPIKTAAYLDPDQEHVLDEYWGPAPRWMVEPELWGNEERKYEMVNAWFWLIDGTHVVRAQVTPFRDAEPPYFKGVYIRVPGQFWGIGALELMLNLQVELNESRNCRQDEINLKLSKPIAVLKSMIASGEFSRIKIGPNAIWLFDNIDDVRKAVMEIELDANLGDSWRGSAEIYNEIQEVTAANKATVGVGGGDDQAGGSTFRGQLLNKQTSSERFIMYARTFEVTGLGKAIRKMYQRIYQFKDFEAAAKILGPERGQKFEFISPEDLDNMAKLVPLGVTTMENKGVKLAQMAEQYKMFAAEEWFKKVDFARRMVVIGGDNDPDTYIMTDEEIKTLNEMKRAAYAEMSQIPGENPQGPRNPSSGGPPPSPIAGDVGGDPMGLPSPATPPRGPGASSIDGFGMPAA